MRIKIISWNINGGIIPDHNQAESLIYFANTIREQQADIVCLQESHTGPDFATATTLGHLCDFPFVYNSPASPSHLQSGMSLGNAILSTRDLGPVTDTVLPYPETDLHFIDGRPVAKHNKLIQHAHFGKYSLLNLHLQPLGLFGQTYESLPDFRHQTDQALSQFPAPVIAIGDFNIDDPLQQFSNFASQYQLREALPAIPTKPHHSTRPDHILVPENIDIISAHIVPTKADHHLCIVELNLV